MRKLESLPEAQLYQVLDYIEFLESRYSDDVAKQVSGLQRLAEGLEDRLRKRAFNPSNLREAFQVVAAADRALSGVAKAGKELLGEIAEGVTGGKGEGATGSSGGDGGLEETRSGAGDGSDGRGDGQEDGGERAGGR